MNGGHVTAAQPLAWPSLVQCCPKPTVLMQAYVILPGFWVMGNSNSNSSGLGPTTAAAPPLTTARVLWDREFALNRTRTRITVKHHFNPHSLVHAWICPLFSTTTTLDMFSNKLVAWLDLVAGGVTEVCSLKSNPCTGWTASGQPWFQWTE